MWAQRSSLLTQSTSFSGVLLTRLAHAVGLASGVGAAGVALEATADRVPAAATAAVAIASLHPRRAYRGLIRDAPFLMAGSTASSSTSVQMLLPLISRTRWKWETPAKRTSECGQHPTSP